MLRDSFLVITAAAILGTAALPVLVWAQDESQEAQEAVAQGPQKIEMIVHGLSCPFCAYGLEKKLRKLEGLDSLSIDFKTGAVVLIVQDGSKAGDERLTELVEDAGFEVAKIERTPIEKEPSGAGGA